MSPIESAGTPVAAHPAEPLTALGSAALLEYGADMTARFDAQITAAMNEMRDALFDTDALSGTRQGVQTLAAELTQAADGDATKPVELTEEQFERLRALGVLDELGLDPDYVFPEEPPELPLRPLGEEWPKPPSISAAVLDRVDSQLELRQNELNSAQEQRLLVLQETMRQRSQLVQLLSNILRENGETMGHVVRNIA